MVVSFLSPSVYWLLNLGVCQLYPGYKTFVYLYGRHFGAAQEKAPLRTVYYAHHLLYWALYLVYSHLESLLPLVKVLPFYYEVKLLFFFWLGSDHFKGAGYLFHRYLTKLFQQLKTELTARFGDQYEEKTKMMLSDLFKSLGTFEDLNLGPTSSSTPSESPQTPEPPTEAPKAPASSDPFD